MPRLLLVTHRTPDQPGGGAARWRSMVRYLPEFGWEVDVVSAPVRASSVEFAEDRDLRRRAVARARAMSRARRLASPAFQRLGLRPPPLSTLWLPRGVAAVRRQLRAGNYDAILATGPPMVALPVARLAALRGDTPLVVEFRDLWAGNPAYDHGGPLLLRLEEWIAAGARAIVACTPEARDGLHRRHSARVETIAEVSNGYEPALLGQRGGSLHQPAKQGLVVLHSGTLTVTRPLGPLLRVLAREPFRSGFRLVLHGHLAPEIEGELAAAAGSCDVDVLPPSSWREAIAQIRSSDITLITQSHDAGDRTAVAAKVYEYLALGKPVLCISSGGATEALLRRIGADRYCARLDDEASIITALERLLREPLPPPLPAEKLAPYDRRKLAARMATTLDGVARGTAGGTSRSDVDQARFACP